MIIHDMASDELINTEEKEILTKFNEGDKVIIDDFMGKYKGHRAVICKVLIGTGSYILDSDPIYPYPSFPRQMLFFEEELEKI